MTRRERWRHWLRHAADIGISPEAFWRLSMAEWRMLTRAPSPPLDRSRLEALMARFPDAKELTSGSGSNCAP